MVRSRASLQNTGHSIGKHQAWVWCLLCPNAPNPWAELLSHSWNLSYSILSREQGTQLTAVWTPLFPSLRSLVGPLITSRKYVNLVLIGETAGITTRSGNTCVWLSLKIQRYFPQLKLERRSRPPCRQSTRLFHMERTGANRSQFPLSWSTQLLSTGLFTTAKCRTFLQHLLKTNTDVWGSLSVFVFWLKFSAKWFSCVWQWQAEQQQRN